MDTHFWQTKDRQSLGGDRLSGGKGVDAAVGRLADITVGCVLLAATLPLLILIALAIKWESPGPVLYRVPRIGRDGRRFDLLHFRTCHFDSDPQSNRSRTGSGCFLHATRLDCLPEVFNLLRGDLSVFGAGLSPWSLF